MIKIILGWFYLLTNRNNELAKKRLSICIPCEHSTHKKCKLCGCYLNAKARLTGEYDEGCPDIPKRWHPVK